MEYHTLKGKLTVSAIALGTAGFGGTSADAAREQKEADAVVGAALDAGINLFDTAQLYGGGRSEEILGRAFRGRRDRALIATKFRDFDSWTKAEMLVRLQVSLRRLDTDHVDLYQMHWPKRDMTPGDIEIMLDGFRDAIRAGLTRFAGISNFRMAHLAMLPPAAGELLITNQVPYSLLSREYDADGASEFCRRHGIALLAYSPSAHGLLTGKYGRENRPVAGALAETEWTREKVYPEAMKVVDELQDVARACGRTPVQAALNWALSRPAMGAAIIGTRNRAHLEENLGAFGWTLDPNLAARLDRASLAFQRFVTGAGTST